MTIPPEHSVIQGQRLPGRYVMDAGIVAQVHHRLEGVAREHQVRLPLCIESGSRAWGFPSPDSDYDCRFIFIRAAEAYLDLWPPRDVIETPLDAVLDVNGWDLGKAVKLLVKGNAVVVEWLTSPIVYSVNPVFRDEMLALARAVVQRSAVASHYLSLLQSQRKRFDDDGGQTPVKKLFYALRPAVALRWLGLHPGAAVAPMHFPTLLEQTDIPAEIADTIAELLTRKAVTRELGSAEIPASIAAFLLAEQEAARFITAEGPAVAQDEARGLANAFFARWVNS